MSISIRAVGTADLASIVEAFELAGCAVTPEQLDRYLAEQSAGLRLFLFATWDGRVGGYLTLGWDAEYPPFRDAGLPEIQDLEVIPELRRRGLAAALLSRAEELASERSHAVGLSVGVYQAYGPAQRLYASRGYLPDGRGMTAGTRSLLGGETVQIDDSLSLHLIKDLRFAPSSARKEPGR